MRKPRQPKIYATLRKRYTTEALRIMGFVYHEGRMVKFGACRSERATATSLDGIWWTVTPQCRHWR